MAGDSCSTDGIPPQQTFCWTGPLRPQLELGLAFDLARKGTLTVPVKTTLPLQGATLHGTLTYIAPSSLGHEEHVLTVADIVAHAPVDVPPNSEGNLLVADIVPTPDGDYVPYQKGAQLYMDLEVSSLGAEVFSFANANTAPVIQPGGLLTDLPLNEYHDAVAQVFSSNATLQLLAAGLQDRTTNPGKTVLFNLTLENDGARS